MKVIYEPRGAAREYAALAANLYAGCSHACTYCYAPNALHQSRAEFVKCPMPRMGVLNALEREAKKMQGDPRPVLLSFTSDPYQKIEAELKITQQALHILCNNDMKVQVLTKNGGLAARDFRLMKNFDVEFGSTICFDSETMREVWEPEAPSIASRMNAIVEAHKVGVRTWVSMEPVFTAVNAVRVIDLLYTHVDRWAIGKLNHMADVEKRVDWRGFLWLVLERLESYGCKYRIKDALWSFADDAIKARWPKERTEYGR